MEKMRQVCRIDNGAKRSRTAIRRSEATCGYRENQDELDRGSEGRLELRLAFGRTCAAAVKATRCWELDPRSESRIGERATCSVEVFHIKVAGSNNWGRMPELVALINSARARGVDINANQYPYIAANHPTLPLLPPWALEGGLDKTMERLRDPQLRVRIKHDIENGLPGWNSNYVLQSGGWKGIVIGATHTEKNASLPNRDA